MTEFHNLPYLVQLLDDPSPVVQEAICRELASFGTRLEPALDRLGVRLSEDQISRLRDIESERRRDTLRANWPAWFHLQTAMERLEGAFVVLSDFQDNYRNPGRLTVQLDEIAREFRETEAEATTPELARFLFEIKGLHGGQSDYYSPDKSNLAQVVETRNGNPISLTCVYMLVGYRLGLEIHGCNFPGHFLARTFHDGEPVLVDCFNGGRFIDAGAFHDLSPTGSRHIARALGEPASVKTIMTRVLNNLINAYNLTRQFENSELMQDLVKMQELALSGLPHSL